MGNTEGPTHFHRQMMNPTSFAYLVFSFFGTKMRQSPTPVRSRLKGSSTFTLTIAGELDKRIEPQRVHRIRSTPFAKL